MLDGGGEKPSWEMILERWERRIRDPLCHVPVPLYIYIYIYTAFRCNPVNVKIPRVPPRSICLHSNYHRPLPPSLAFFFVFLTRNQPPPSSKLSEETDRYLKARAFLFFFFLHLPSLPPFLYRWRTMVAQSIARGKFKFSFLYPTFDSVGEWRKRWNTLSLPPPPGSKDYFNRVAALSTNVKSASGVSARRRKGGEKIGRLETEASGMSGQYLLWIQVERFCPGNRLKLGLTNNTGKTCEEKEGEKAWPRSCGENRWSR